MEMVEDFVKLGYELFVDKESLRSEFLVANIMQPTSVSIYEHIQGDTDIIYASSFFHLFTLEEQFELAMKVVDILRPRAGSMILGRQLGSVRPGIYPLRKLEEGKLYRHDVASFTQMWKDVGDATGTVWSVDAALDEEELGYKGNESWGDPDMRRLRFAVYRQ